MLKIIYFEIYKMYKAKKIYILSSIVIMFSILLPVGIYIAQTIEGVAQSPVNGQSMPLMLLASLGNDILPILIIIISAGLIADELRDGTLKQVLIRPVKRWEVMAAKMCALLTTIVFLLGVGLVSGYIVGTMAFGWGDGFATQSVVLNVGQGISYTLGAFAISIIPLFAFGLIVLTISQLFISSGAVIGIGIGIYFAMALASSLIADIRISIINEYFTMGFKLVNAFSWPELFTGLGVSIVYILLFGFLSFIILNKRDIMY